MTVTYRARLETRAYGLLVERGAAYVSIGTRYYELSW